MSQFVGCSVHSVRSDLKVGIDPSEEFPSVVRCHVHDEGYIVSLRGRMESRPTMVSVCLFVVVS